MLLNAGGPATVWSRSSATITPLASLIDDERHTVDLPHGANLRRVLLDAGYSPYARLTRRLNCSGRGRCATCGVWLETDAPPPDHWHDGVAAWAEQELGATLERTRRAIFGYSNGGVFAGETALRHPERFGVAMPFSAGYAPTIKRYHPRHAVRWYAAAGLFEGGFYAQTRAFALALERAGAEVLFSARAAGHDYVMWEEEFAAAVRWAFAHQT